MDEREINLFFLAVFLQKRPLRDSWSGSGFETRAPSQYGWRPPAHVKFRVTGTSGWGGRWWSRGPCSSVLRRQLGSTASLCFAALSHANTQRCTVSFQVTPGPEHTRASWAAPAAGHIHNQSVLSSQGGGTPGVVECQGLFVLFWLAPTWQELIFLLMTPCCEKAASAGRAWVRGEGAALRLCGPKWGGNAGGDGLEGLHYTESFWRNLSERAQNILPVNCPAFFSCFGNC